MTLISIIMPAYNTAIYIEESIASVQKQTFANWELIIVDDGSTDDTREIVSKLAQNDSRVRYLYQQNKGQGKARNYALTHAVGDFIAFLDADDVWVVDKLEIQLKQLKAYPEIDLVFCGGYVFKHTVLNKVETFNFNNNKLYSGNEAIRYFISRNPIPILTVLVRKDALEKVGFFNESRYLQNVEDYHLWFKLLLHGYKLKSYEHNLAYYRFHDKQSTSNKFHLVLKEINLLLTVYHTYKEFRRLILKEIKQKYLSLFMEPCSINERQELYLHYTKHINTFDKPFFRLLMPLLPKRLFSIYFRRIHSFLFINFKRAQSTEVLGKNL